jgi:hypothetical protein
MRTDQNAETPYITIIPEQADRDSWTQMLAFLKKSFSALD